MKLIHKIDKLIYLSLFASLFVFIIYACSDDTKITEPNPEDNYDYLTVPEHFPPIPFPENNPYSYEKVELGRFLYYDNILTNDPSIKSCSHCLKQSNAFCDNKNVSIGFMDEPEHRNAMSLANAAYRNTLFWDGRGTAIEQPAYRSIFLFAIFGSDTNVVNQKLQASPMYQSMFKKAFGENAVPSSFLASQAIATFVRTFVSANSRYDQYLLGKKDALNESEKRGMELFFSERTRCSVCHSGFLFTDLSFHNTGVNTHYFDRGRFLITGIQSDRGKFLTPTLRNIELTAPYMHDGQLLTLEAIIEHYNSGGKPFINKDTLMRPLFLTDTEKQDLINFLKSLTDWELINNPKFKNPHLN